MTRLRQIRVEGFNGEPGCWVAHNDGESGRLESQEELDSLLQQLVQEGWTKESRDSDKDGWRETYSLLVEEAPPPAGLFERVFSTGSVAGSAIGRDAVALSGGWMVCGARSPDAAADLFRRTAGGEWRFHATLRPKALDKPVRYPVVAIHGDRLWLGLPEQRRVAVYRRDAGDAWVEQEAPLTVGRQFADRFGTRLTYASGVLAVDGWFESHAATFLFEENDGRWRQIARLPLPEARAVPAVAISGGDWVAVGLGSESSSAGGVMLAARQPGAAAAWAYQGMLSRAHLPEGANFGAALAAHRGRLAVSSLANSHGAAAIHFFRLRDQEWEFEASVPARFLQAWHSLALAEGMLVVGNPRQNNGCGAVEVFSESGGRWNPAQTLTLPDARLGDSLGSMVAFDTGELVAGSSGGAGRTHVFRLHAGL